ncbi:MAG: ATP-dependent helicase [Desulfosarcina sp.]|nr:ATP-dependent helicase [Desulfobacterales bacterium]
MKQQTKISDNTHKTIIDYKKELNPSQLDAVTSTEGPLLIIAGAGSGKTRTLTYRVAYLVEKGVSPQSILLLTFTRKASQEMLNRAARLLDARCARVSGGTFHSFANTVLRIYANKIGFGHDFSIIDRSDSESLINMIRKDSGHASKNRSFPRKQTLANIFSRTVNKVLSIGDVVSHDYPHFLNNLEEIIEINKEYANQKRINNLLDYDDLLIYLHLLLKTHLDVREKLCSLYRYIMVDEYQDTNPVQAEIVHFLAGREQNIMIVGDDSQSIYSFRGADFMNIMRFPKIFPSTRIIKLEENYRSVQPILDLTNMIIENAETKYSKKLFTNLHGGTMPAIIRTEDEYAQSGIIVKKIKRLNEKGIPLNEIAVLFRAGFHSFGLELQLTKNNIPFIKMGGFKFMDSAHIKDVIAHLKAFASQVDKISWHRILLLLNKIGPAAARKIFASVSKKGWDAGLSDIKLKGEAGEGSQRVKSRFAKMKLLSGSVSDMGETIIEYYMPILKKKYDDYPKRAKQLEHIVDIMERYTVLSEFFTDMALEPPNTVKDDSFSMDSLDNDRLVLSTVHSAKGLEWNTVFVIWTLDGRFPSVHALNKENELEEELRLMYVAATRAKENLFFIYPGNIYDRSSNSFLCNPSCFLDVIPDSILERDYR